MGALEISLTDQMQGFYLACITGAVLGLLFDVFRIVRILLNCKKISVFFQDLFCMFVAGVATFLVALATNWGQIRFYMLAGEAIGFCIYFLTAGEITVRLAKLICKILDKICCFLKRFFLLPIVKMIKKVFHFFYKKWKNRKFILKKFRKQKKSLETSLESSV